MIMFMLYNAKMTSDFLYLVKMEYKSAKNYTMFIIFLTVMHKKYLLKLKSNI